MIISKPEPFTGRCFRKGLLVKSGVGGIEPPYYEQCTFLTLTSFHPISLKTFASPESCRISFEHKCAKSIFTDGLWQIVK